MDRISCRIEICRDANELIIHTSCRLTEEDSPERANERIGWAIQALGTLRIDGFGRLETLGPGGGITVHAHRLELRKDPRLSWDDVLEWLFECLKEFLGRGTPLKMLTPVMQREDRGLSEYALGLPERQLVSR